MHTTCHTRREREQEQEEEEAKVEYPQDGCSGCQSLHWLASGRTGQQEEQEQDKQFTPHNALTHVVRKCAAARAETKDNGRRLRLQLGLAASLNLKSVKCPARHTLPHTLLLGLNSIECSSLLSLSLLCLILARNLRPAERLQPAPGS